MIYVNKRNSNSFRNAAFVIFIVIVVEILLSINVFAESESIEGQIVNEQSQSSELIKLEEQLKKYSNKDSRDIIAGYDPQKIVKEAAKGKFELNISSLINGTIKYLFKEIYTNIDILIKLIVIVVLCSILKNLQTSFLSESVGELAFYTCYIIIVSIILISFNTALNLGKEIIDNMVCFMQATIPVMVTLLVSGGNLTTAGIFQPLLIMIVEIAATLMRNIFIPLIFLSTILSIVNNISDKVQISKLSGFLKQISGWALGLILTMFIAIITIQGSLGAVVDGVTSKTAKFAIGAFIPVVGKYLADAAETVIGCTLLIKNAAGLSAMIGILVICIVPILKICAIMLLYRMTCVLIEPIAEKRITNCINDIAGSLTYVIGIVVSVAFMFLISITAIISAGNISAMIR